MQNVCNLESLCYNCLNKLTIFDDLMNFFVARPFAFLARQHHDWGVDILNGSIREVNVKYELAPLLPEEKEMPSVHKFHINLKGQGVWVNARVVMKHVLLKDLEHELSKLVVIFQFLLLCW